jgi:hypothetical protein
LADRSGFNRFGRFYTEPLEEMSLRLARVLEARERFYEALVHSRSDGAFRTYPVGRRVRVLRSCPL